VPMIQDYLSNGEDRGQTTNGDAKTVELKAVSFEHWVKVLEESGKQNGVDVVKNPGLKLLDFYRRIIESNTAVELSTAVASKGSETMSNLKAVNDKWMRLWLEQWNF
jgi:hypothetical protein